MKRILAKSTLRAFWELYPDSKIYLQTWYEIAVHAVWKSPDEIKQVFAHASILKDSRVVFNIKGNKYRLVVKINYSKQWMFIRFIGTHEEYDKIDANTI
jgi:mRNA interferase HigB